MNTVCLQLTPIIQINFRLFAAYEEENDSTTEIVQILEYLSGGQLFEKIIESPYSKLKLLK